MKNKFVKLGIHDIEKIIEFEKICFPDEQWKRSDWIDLLSDERFIYLTQIANFEIVSNIFLYNWADERDFLKIMNLSVHPNYRGKGRGHELLKEAINNRRE